MNSPHFYTAIGVKPGGSLYLTDNKRIHIWKEGRLLGDRIAVGSVKANNNFYLRWFEWFDTSVSETILMMKNGSSSRIIWL